jgi:hypothetical protein
LGYDSHIWDEEGISFYAKGVYLLLAKFVNKEWKCWPSLRRMEKMSGLSRPTLVKALKELKTNGYIKLLKSDKKTGNNVYLLAKLEQVVKDVYQVKQVNHQDAETKGDKGEGVISVAGVVKEINQGGKGRLPGVVKDVNTNLSIITLPENYILFCDWFNERFGRKYKASVYKDKINTRLKNYTMEQLKTACLNMKASKYMMGDNDAKKVYATLEYITRNDKNVDKWLEEGQANGHTNGNSGDPERDKWAGYDLEKDCGFWSEDDS